MPAWWKDETFITFAERRAIQAEAYGRIVEACYAIDGFKNVTIWGVTDKYTWEISNTGPKPSQNPDASFDSFLFDTEYNAKEANTAVHDALSQSLNNQ